MCNGYKYRFNLTESIGMQRFDSQQHACNPLVPCLHFIGKTWQHFKYFRVTSDMGTVCLLNDTYQKTKTNSFSLNERSWANQSSLSGLGNSLPVGTAGLRQLYHHGEHLQNYKELAYFRLRIRIRTLYLPYRGEFYISPKLLLTCWES